MKGNWLLVEWLVVISTTPLLTTPPVHWRRRRTMQKQIRLYTKLFFIITFVAIYTSSVYAKRTELFEPPRLFDVPVADTLKSFDINISGAGTFGTDRFSFLGTGYLGLGKMVQLEIGAVKILRKLNEEYSELTNIPAAGIKILFPGERVSWMLPDISASFRRTFGREEAIDSIIYKKELADLFAMASKTIIAFKGWRGIRLHGGVDYIGASLTGSKPQEFLKPFGGIEIWTTKKAKLMGEFKWMADFGTEDKPELQEEPVWVAIAGARVFLTRFLTTDIGLKYQENFKTAADARIEARVSLAIPTHLVLK